MNQQHVNKETNIKKIKDFFQGATWHKFLVFFAFIVLAFIFWLTQYYQRTFEVELDISVGYKNVPSDVVLSKTIPHKITVKISDKGTVILGYNFRLKKEKIWIDLIGIDNTATSYTVDQVTLSAAIRNTLAGSTSLISFYPNDLRINYLPLTGKELPVVIDGKITPAQGFIITDSIRINPDRVTVYSDSITLDTLKFIKTESLSKQSVNKSISEEVKLVSPQNTSLSTDVVNIEVTVEEYTEKTFTIPIQIANIPDNMNIRLFPPEVEVICNIPLANYSQLTDEDLAIVVDYRIPAEATTNSITFDLTKKPNYIIDYRISPDKVDFLIEKVK